MIFIMDEMGEAGAYFMIILVIAYKIFGKIESSGRCLFMIYKWVHTHHIPNFIAFWNYLTSNEEE